MSPQVEQAFPLEISRTWDQDFYLGIFGIKTGKWLKIFLVFFQGYVVLVAV